MTPFSIDLTTIVCTFSNQTIDSCRSAASPSEPYLFASSEERAVWYDGKALLKKLEEDSSTVKKVHLFAQFTSGIFFVAECESHYLRPLYLNPSKESLRQEPNDEALVDALSYHYKRAVENYQTCNELFLRVQEGVLESDARLSLVMGRVFLRVNNEQNKALIYLVASANKGNIKAALIAGQIFLKGVGGVSDIEGKKQAKALLEKVPQDALDSQIQLKLGKLYLDTGETQKAADLFHKLANNGDPAGCYEFAGMIPKGDSDKGRYPWFEKAALAEPPHPLASYEAAMILKKWGDSKNDPLMRRFFLQAAVKGNREAAFHAGMMCKKGLGGEKELERAQELFLESEKEIGKEAYFEAGLVNMELGRVTAATDYFSRAARAGHEGAAKELEGLGVDKLSSRKSASHSSSSKSSSSRSDSDSPSSRGASSSPSSSRKKKLVEYTRSYSAGDADLPGEELPRRGSPDPLAEEKKDWD